MRTSQQLVASNFAFSSATLYFICVILIRKVVLSRREKGAKIEDGVACVTKSLQIDQYPGDQRFFRVLSFFSRV